LSSNNPNLQNIPIRTERGRQIRKAFVARRNYTLVSADYSQIELRVIAALSGEENMIKAFQNQEDIHKSTASKVFNVRRSNCATKPCQNGKFESYMFLLLIKQSNQLVFKESADLIEAYYQTYPRLKSYIQEQIDFARDNGFVQTIVRPSLFKDIQLTKCYCSWWCRTQCGKCTYSRKCC
jgi:DNA polymerase-1